MRRTSSILSVLLILFLFAQAFAAGGSYVSSEQVDLVRLLAPPPADDSPKNRVELAELLEIQRKRTPEQAAAAATDARKSVFLYADVLGPKFIPENLPAAVKLFDRLHQTENAVVGPAKITWNRTRPTRLSAEIKPCAMESLSQSYPSGVSSYAYLAAVVLANIVPEKKEEIFDRAAHYAYNRVICGVHFPSDVEGGKLSGTIIAAFVMQNPEFQAEYATAKAEIRKVLGY